MNENRLYFSPRFHARSLLPILHINLPLLSTGHNRLGFDFVLGDGLSDARVSRTVCARDCRIRIIADFVNAIACNKYETKCIKKLFFKSQFMLDDIRFG